MSTKTLPVVLATMMLSVLPVSALLAQSTETPENRQLLADGKLIFEETAGGFGCAACHGMTGTEPDIAPPNAGASEGEIRDALGAVAEMQGIKLRPAEMHALAAYVKYLGDQTLIVSTEAQEVVVAVAATPENDDTLAQGKLIFEETAGGIGCATCHGMDGAGDSAPANAGADEIMVNDALQGVEEMSSLIKLKHAEVKAVVAYLKYLGEQPVVVATTEPTPENDDVLAQGKLIFEETAGGIGCATCHGMDGSGDMAPANAGADESMVREALNGVEDMSMIKLKHNEIAAVTAYLKYLGEHPNEN